MRICIIAVAGALLTCHASDPAIAAETRSGEAATSASPPLAEAPFSKETARSLQQSWASHLKQEVVETNSLGMKMVLLPPGEFTMGRNEEQFDELVKVVDADPEMKKNRGGQIVWSMLMMPAHRVRLTKPFYMGATEVTVAQFRQFADASGYRTEAEQGLNSGVSYKGGRPMSTWRKPMAWRKNYKQQDDEPVMHLCWNDCVAFCKWLSEKEGVEYALPTEAEWEYACRAGTTTPWSFGDFDVSEEEASQYAIWSNGMQKFDAPQRVAQRKPNPFGLYDMHGNMWEYVADWWHRYTYKESPLNDPTGPVRQSEKNDLRRIIRGSSFDWGRWGGDSAHRMRITQRSNQHPHMSFRVAMRIKDVAGVPPAIDPDDELRRRKRDPGADSEQVAAALKAGAVTVAADGKPLPEELSIELSDKVKMEFVLIPAGSFVMGSEHGDRDELPLHRVVISRPFYMARYELTQSQWEALMGTHQGLAGLTRGGDHEMSGPTKAMNLLSWNDCQRFIQKVKAKAPSHAFALPTEAQWEYACRAGSTTTFSFGDDESQLGQHAYYQGNMNWPGQPGFGGKAFYHDVGQKKPNAWGLYDMHGGVWEWCNDWYDSRYYFDAPLVDPAGPEAGRFRVLRGGSWFRYAKYARTAYRKFFHPEGDGDAVTAYINDFGCRLVINPGTGGKREQAATPGDRSRDPGSGSTAEKKAGVEVDFTKLARSLVRRSEKPVITVGRKGEWDDQTLGCMTVLDDGQRFYFYSGGAQFGKAKNIGMATSVDGIHWRKPDLNPLFPGAMPYVVKVRDTFRIYYPGKDEAGRQGLLMRTSTDGFQWSAPQLVLGGGFLDPCVVQIAEDCFHLYYCGGGQVTRNGKKVWEFKAHMATSADGIAWQKISEPALPLGPEGSWDAASHAGPVVLKLGDGFHMWHLGSGEYNGKVAWRIGHATSPDGLKWTKSGDTPVLDVGKPGAWDGGTFMSFDIVYRDGKLLFWYAADPGEHDDESKMSIQIGYGTSQPENPRNASKTHHPPEAKAPFNAQQAGEFQQQWAEHVGRPRVLTNSIGMKMVLLPPGEFRMGLSEQDTWDRLCGSMRKSSNKLENEQPEHGGLLTEMPAHQVRLNKPFYMGECEVTVAQFRQFADATGYQTDAERGLVYDKPYEGERPIRTWREPVYPDRPADQQAPRDNDPVMHLDWNDCMAFCEWLSRQEASQGFDYSLPTSAQWEYACRAGTSTVWYFGDEDAFDKVAPQYEFVSWKGRSPRAVGQGKPNPFGLYDMHGNMMEWMKDWLHDYYYLESPLNDPPGPDNESEERNKRRMVRGGAFEVGKHWSRSSWFVRIAQGSNQHRHPGFRVAMHIRDLEGVAPPPEPDLEIVGEDKTPADPVAAQQAAVTTDRPRELQLRLNENVSMEFVLEVRKKVADRDFRLPTEAEWEYACRAGSKTEYCYGDDPAQLDEYASFCADDAPRWSERDIPDFRVGQRKPNIWGIHDMHGNVREWCSDWWDKDYYNQSPLVDPQGPEGGHFRILRGGNIRNYARFGRSAFRFFMLPNLEQWNKAHMSGARLVINLPVPDTSDAR